MSAGFIQAGIDVLAAYDNWSVALDTYCRNIGSHVEELDLSDTKKAAEAIKEHCPDVVIGGPPCQDFSTAGKREEGGRADLTKAFAKIVVDCRPTFFLMENVPQVRLSTSYSDARKELFEAGYDLSEIVLDASYCGVPQARKRFFSFGSCINGSSSHFYESLNDRLSLERMTVKDYLRDEIDIEFYYRHPRNYSRRSVFSVHEPSPTVRGVNRPIPPGYAGNHLDSVPPSCVRPLTTEERSRIQTFPANWNWNSRNRNANTELQLGNAVPVELATFVASGILDASSK